MAFRVGLHNFSKGCLSDELQGRQDVAAYNAGMKRCENAYILKYGGITGRPGTRLVYETTTPNVRLMPFEVSKDQTYMMLFEHGSMKPMYLGGMVLEQELAITGISNASQAVVTAPFHGFSVGAEVYIDGQLGMTEINGRVLKVQARTRDTFTLNVNSLGFGKWDGNVGGITRTADPAAPTPAPAIPAPASAPEEPAIGSSGGGGSGGEVFGGGTLNDSEQQVQ